MAYSRRNKGSNRILIWVVLGVIAGSFIPDNFSPLVLFKKKSDKK